MTTLETTLWRAVATHLEAPAGLKEVWPTLVERLGATSAKLWGIDAESLEVHFVASCGPASRARVPTLTREQVVGLLAWIRAGEIVSIDDVPPVVRELESTKRRDTKAIALCDAQSHTHGVLVMGARHARNLSDLQGPLTALLTNHLRLDALVRARDAFAADRRALLTKLGRDEVNEGIVGAETGMREVVERIAQVAPTDVPVLLLGETGSGKEVVSRQIHSQSPRAEGPMLRVNCGAIPSELIDSELFGHEAGSFTGAKQTRRGWFERADDGTLFLDEVGELPHAAQVRLLRVLQDGTIERVGGEHSLQVDVRVVAATHRNLEEMVAHGNFRRDLLYRLNVFPIRIPALRERRQDIPALADHFSHRAAKRFGTKAVNLTASDISLLVAYDWPGNVRELQAVIDRATILGNGERLEIALALGTPDRAAVTPEQPTAPLGVLDNLMRDHIVAALQRCLGRIEGPFGAARALDINPHTLRARMRKLGINWRNYRAKGL